MDSRLTKMEHLGPAQRKTGQKTPIPVSGGHVTLHEYPGDGKGVVGRRGVLWWMFNHHVVFVFVIVFCFFYCMSCFTAFETLTLALEFPHRINLPTSQEMPFF
jgi:hypothetical protein